MAKSPSSPLLILLYLVVTGFSVYNIVVCGRELRRSSCKKHHGGLGSVLDVWRAVFRKHGGHLKIFLTGSLLSSGVTMATKGRFPAIPHLVFAILGRHTWKLQNARPCGVSVPPPSLVRTMRGSVIALWCTFALNVLYYVVAIAMACANHSALAAEGRRRRSIENPPPRDIEVARAAKTPPR